MGNSDCCTNDNLDIITYDNQINEKNPKRIVDFYMKVIERINQKLINEKKDIISKSYLTNLSNIPELIEIINKNIELTENNKDNVEHNIEGEVKNNLKEKIDIIIYEVEEKIKIVGNEIKSLSELELKQNEEMIYYLNLYEPYKKKVINYIDNINTKDLKDFLNKKIPSKKEFSILKLIFLIANPGEEEKIPGLILLKDLEVMQEECFKKGPDQIKQKMIESLDDLSLISFDIFEKNKSFTNYPYKEMNDFHQNLFNFFQSFFDCKKSFDIYKPFLETYRETKKNKESLIKKKERLEKIIKEIKILL